jgi:hypothetical protein
MIGTIRKHSKWLWLVIATLTIVSFVYYFNPSQRMNSAGGGIGENNFGSIYGQKITTEQFETAENDFYLSYLFRSGQWPDKSQISEEDLNRYIYVRLMITKKADQLGVHVSDEEAAAYAGNLLRSFGRTGRGISMDEFTKEVLPTRNLTVTDFENYTRHELSIQQVVEAVGLSGLLVTPQEAAAEYTREHQEISAQIVLFSASNYLSRVSVTPQAVAQFYTNYLAEYRLPDRVQVNYVEFDVTNFLTQSKAEWARTNLEEVLEANYRQLTPNYFPDAKTPDEIKAKLRELLIRQRALADARVQANDFATALFAVEPPRPENLAVVAKQKHLTVKTTAPFDAQHGPEDFSTSEDFAKAAFGLNADEPFAGPIAGSDAIYIIALEKNLPSEIPSFDEIHARVTRDFQMEQAMRLAESAGTNFAPVLATNLAAGKNFAAACVAAGFSPQILPPLSLSTRGLPGFAANIDLNELKQAAFMTPIGHASGFEPTDDGGFIVFVQSQLPVDSSAMSADLPQFTADLRRSRENDAFQEWLNVEANRELRDTPLFKKPSATDVEK